MELNLREVLCEFAAGVTTLTLNRPNRRNAITTVMLAELIFAVEQCAQDSAVRAVVLRGADQGFCSGDDLSGMGPLPEDFASHPQRDVSHAALQTALRELSKPTVAVVHGFAFGVGLDLAMACDFRIAADNTRLQDQRVMFRGMHAVTGCAWFQSRAIGMTRALQFLILGESVDGTTAADWGMVSESVPEADLDTRVAALAGSLATAPTKAIGLMKRQIYAAQEMNHAEFMAFAAPLIREVEIKDRQEGINAFLEKRPAEFTGE